MVRKKGKRKKLVGIRRRFIPYPIDPGFHMPYPIQPRPPRTKPLPDFGSIVSEPPRRRPIPLPPYSRPIVPRPPRTKPMPGFGSMHKAITRVKKK